MYDKELIVIEPVKENIPYLNFEFKENKVIYADKFLPGMVTFILNVLANESIELITPNNLSELLYPDWSKYIKNEEDINIVYDMLLRELVEESSNYICKK